MSASPTTPEGDEQIVALANHIIESGHYLQREEAYRLALWVRAMQSETARSDPQPGTFREDAVDARRYRRLKDAAGRTWDKLAGDHLVGQLDSAIDRLGDDE